MYAQRTKQASIGKLLASLGLGGLIGGGIGRVSGYNAGNQAGYSEGSANASKDTLINLLKGMTGVVQQGAESKLDLKKLLDSKSGAMPALPVAPLNAASIKTAKLRRILRRVEKSAAEKQAIAALLAALKGGGGKAMGSIEKLMGKATPKTPFVPRGTLNTGLESSAARPLSFAESALPTLPKGFSGGHPAELPDTDIMHKLFMLNQKFKHQN
jgi:hypothetical protein